MPPPPPEADAGRGSPPGRRARCGKPGFGDQQDRTIGKFVGVEPALGNVGSEGGELGIENQPNRAPGLLRQSGGQGGVVRQRRARSHADRREKPAPAHHVGPGFGSGDFTGTTRLAGDEAVGGFRHFQGNQGSLFPCCG